MWCNKQVADVLAELKTTEKGLSEHEASSRLVKYGQNELKKTKKEPAYKKFLKQFTGFLILILITAMALSFLAGHVVDAMVIAVIILLNGFLGFIQEYKAEKAIEALKKMSSPSAVVVRQGKEMRIPAKEIVPGDIVLLEAGDIVPADCRIINAANLKVDEASLTGESIPVSKSAEPVKDSVPIGEMKSMLFMSTYVTYGTAKAVAAQTGMSTEIGKIAELIQEDSRKTPLQVKLEQFGKQIGVLVIIISIVITLLGVFRGNPPLEMFILGASIAVAAVPEGLPAIVTITLALGLQRMAKKRAIVRKLPAVETLGSTTVICSDKTGTITKNEMTVTEIFAAGKTIKVTGLGYNTKGDFYENGKKVGAKEKNAVLLLRIGLLCNNASVENEKLIGDPTEGALVVAAEKAGISTEIIRNNHPKIAELPFDSVRKMMTTVHVIDSDGIKSDYEAYCKGAPEMILAKCSSIYKNGKILPLTKKEKNEIEIAAHDMASKALRVLAFAYKNISRQKEYTFKIEEDLVFIGLAGMIDSPREEVKYSIEKCRQAGIRVMMLTGDYPATAKAIAVEIGLVGKEERVVSGQELEIMDDNQLSKAVESVNVFARISPEHKMRIVKMLQERGEIVAVTGDGVNDAPALKKADIGVAMGIRGTEVSKEASDMILTDDNFSTIVSAVEEGRTIFSNIKKFINYLLSCNAGEVITMFIAGLVGFAVMPLLPVQILWMNLVTDGLPAMALGVEPPEKDVMKKKPLRSTKTVSKKDALYIIGVGTLVSLVTLALFLLELSEEEIARTTAFTTLMMLQMAVAVSIKNEKSIFRGGRLLNNKMLIGSVITSVALQMAVIYIPFLQVVFKTVSLPLEKIAVIFAVCIAFFLMLELLKMRNKGNIR